MQVEVSFSDRSVKEVQKTPLSWFVSAYELIANFFPLVVILSCPVAAAISLAKQIVSQSSEWSSGVGLLIISFIPVAYVAFRLRQRTARKRRAIMAGYPQVLTLSSDGIETRDAAGRTLFAPWHSYSGFKQGESIVFLRLAGKFSYRAIPIDRLSQETQGQFRAILLSNLQEL